MIARLIAAPLFAQLLPWVAGGIIAVLLALGGWIALLKVTLSDEQTAYAELETKHAKLEREAAAFALKVAERERLRDAEHQARIHQIVQGMKKEVEDANRVADAVSADLRAERRRLRPAIDCAVRRDGVPAVARTAGGDHGGADDAAGIVGRALAAGGKGDARLRACQAYVRAQVTRCNAEPSR